MMKSRKDDPKFVELSQRFQNFYNENLQKDYEVLEEKRKALFKWSNMPICVRGLGFLFLLLLCIWLFCSKRMILVIFGRWDRFVWFFSMYAVMFVSLYYIECLFIYKKETKKLVMDKILSFLGDWKRIKPKKISMDAMANSSDLEVTLRQFRKIEKVIFKKSILGKMLNLWSIKDEILKKANERVLERVSSNKIKNDEMSNQPNLWDSFYLHEYDDCFEGKYDGVDVMIADQACFSVPNPDIDGVPLVFRGVLIAFKLNKKFKGKTLVEKADLASMLSNRYVFSFLYILFSVSPLIYVLIDYYREYKTIDGVLLVVLVALVFFLLFVLGEERAQNQKFNEGECGQPKYKRLNEWNLKYGHLKKQPQKEGFNNAMREYMEAKKVALNYEISEYAESKYAELKRVKLEDVEFGKQWVVQSSHQVEARYLLTPVFMERMLEVQRRFHGKGIEFVVCDNMVLISVPTWRDMFETTSLLRSNRYCDVEEVLGQFYAIFSAIDVLNGKR